MRLRNLESGFGSFSTNPESEPVNNQAEQTEEGQAGSPEALDQELSEKKEAYEKLCEGTPDAFYILGAGSKEWKEDRFKSMSYADLDYEGKGHMSGGKARNVAAAQLYKYFPESLVVANSGGADQEIKDAEIFASELKYMGVEAEDIVVQTDSHSTFSELLELIKMITERNWQHVAVVTNDFQIPRAKAMLEHIDELHDPGGYWQRPEIQAALTKYNELEPKPKITFVPAEEVLLLRSERYQSLLDKVKASEDYQKRVEAEARGTKMINDGTYWKN